MNKKKIVICLMLLPLLITLISLQFLPDQIPAHYDINNQVTRWGSKYETLIYPFISLLIGTMVLGITKYLAKREIDGNNNEKLTLSTGVFLLIMVNVMMVYYLYTDFNQIENLSTVAISIYQIIFFILGVFMIVIGNMMPKARLNSLIGLRTYWSMKNDDVWKKCQRFGGIISIIEGVIIILICCMTSDMYCLMLSLIVLIIFLPIEVYYTYWVSKKLKKDSFL